MDSNIRWLVIAGLLTSAGFAGCAAPSESASDTPTATTSQTDAASPRTDSPKSVSAGDLAVPPDAWVSERVDKARRRLSTSEAGQLVLASIDAHGGLQRWYANGPLFFRFTYAPLNGHTPRDTYQTVDTWSARARHELADQRQVQFGWTGHKAWVAPADAELKVNPRFWALTPYYFVAMPFVLADPGIHLAKVGQKTLDGRTYDVVKASFGEDVGDAPDDHYIVYLDAETARFGALRYVVSYPGFFPNGGHSPEKLMIYEGKQSVDGITFAGHMSTYKWTAEPDSTTPNDAAASSEADADTAADDGQRGPKVTDITLGSIDFRPKTADDFFDAPDDARMVDGY